MVHWQGVDRSGQERGACLGVVQIPAVGGMAGGGCRHSSCPCKEGGREATGITKCIIPVDAPELLHCLFTPPPTVCPSPCSPSPPEHCPCGLLHNLQPDVHRRIVAAALRRKEADDGGGIRQLLQYEQVRRQLVGSVNGLAWAVEKGQQLGGTITLPDAAAARL